MDHILLLEDIPEIRTWLKTLVQQVFPRAVITECARVADALAAVPRQRFELALLDLGLPDGSGVSVVEALRDQQPEAQSVIVTIHDDDEHLFQRSKQAPSATCSRSRRVSCWWSSCNESAKANLRCPPPLPAKSLPTSPASDADPRHMPFPMCS
ncbi:MAG: response regulator [Inhella sp.]